METDIFTASQKILKDDCFDTLVYKTKNRYSTLHCTRVIETEHGKYIASNRFMHGAEDGDLT